MPRSARIALPHYPHHLVHRGHNRRDVFRNDGDRNAYLGTLQEFRTELKLKVYGYCLMTNHVHLIVDPGDDPSNLGRLMKRLAARHTRRMNHVEQRSGTLWNGRFKCSPIETDRYLLTCLRYVDRNPVRAKIVGRPEEFRWSSYRAKAGLIECDWLDTDPCTADLADSVARCQERYREFVAQSENELELKFIRESLQLGHVTSSDQFAKTVEREINATLPQRRRGRPLVRDIIVK
jgi:putative transposase